MLDHMGLIEARVRSLVRANKGRPISKDQFRNGLAFEFRGGAKWDAGPSRVYVQTV